jgi:hypothetical protein
MTSFILLTGNLLFSPGFYKMQSLSQNPVGFGKGCGESGLKPAFSAKSKVTFPKTEFLGKPLQTPFRRNYFIPP